jgi:hypothetical protein
VPSLLDTFRILASFKPPKVSLAQAPWDRYVEWAINQGLGPLAAYNLEFVLAGGGAPEWVRERLLSVYQGTLNDNVMKLVHFKRTLASLVGRRVVVLGAAALAEVLYPHLAFRPIEELRLWVAPGEVSGLAGFLREAEFRPQEGHKDGSGASQLLFDGRTQLFLHGHLFGEPDDTAVRARTLPVKVFGPSLYRLEPEDALLTACFMHARLGYDVPLIQFVDVRELVLGAPQLGGPFSRPLNLEVLHARARSLRLTRALYASLGTVAHLFPEAAVAAEQAFPPLRKATQRLLDRLVVGPASILGRERTLRGAPRLRSLLAGGRVV